MSISSVAGTRSQSDANLAVRQRMAVGALAGGALTGVAAYVPMARATGLISGPLIGGLLGFGAGIATGSVAAGAHALGVDGKAGAALGGGLGSAAAVGGLGLLASRGGAGGRVLALMGAPLAGGALGATIGGVTG